MTQITKKQIKRISNCYTKDSQLYVEFKDGSGFKHINKADGRFEFTDDKLQTNIIDKAFENIYISKTNELKDDTVEVECTGTVTIAGASGSVDGITVNGVEVMSGAEAFDTDLDTTAQNIADNINAGPQKDNYIASATGAVITITALAYNKTDANGYVVVATTTTLTTTDVNMSGGVTAIISDVDAETDEIAVATHLGAFVGI